MKSQTLSVFSLLLVGISACANGDPCDPGMELDRNYCVMKDSAGGGAGGETSDDPEPEPPSDDFGKVCTDNAACGGDAPDCAIAPGEDEGTCSVLGCDSTPEEVVCPLGYHCFTLGDVCLVD